jgi:hypothetical protein
MIHTTVLSSNICVADRASHPIETVSSYGNFGQELRYHAQTVRLLPRPMPSNFLKTNKCDGNLLKEALITMTLRSVVLVAMASAVAAFAQNPITADSPYQISYASNLTIGNSVVNITNTGANGAGFGFGTSASVTGAFCANVYVFTPDEEIVSCCSCPVTPNGLVSLSAQADLISNPLTRVTPTSVVIKLVATAPVGGTCNNSAAAIGTAALVNGMAAWGTKLHANTSSTGGFAVTETAFTPATLSAGEQARLAYTCGIVLNQGSGFGVCSSCRLGGLGAAKQ